MRSITLVISGLLIFSCTVADAQYRINKQKYDYHSYVYQPGDPYNPGTAGFASLIVPGLGQMISGETGRGLASMGRCVLCLGCSFEGLMIISKGDERDPDFMKRQKTGTALWMGGFALAVVNWAFGIGDAVKVAKVNNMALRGKKNRQGELTIQPYLGLPTLTPENRVMAGFSLKINFLPRQTLQ